MDLALHEAQELLVGLLPHTGSARRIGISGVPGVGKSTLMGQLARGLEADIVVVGPGSLLTSVLPHLLVDGSRQAVMGHSMGAATVMRVGAEYPDLAKSVVMLDPGLGRRPGGPLDLCRKPLSRIMAGIPRSTR